jgi:hypothetical protein
MCIYIDIYINITPTHLFPLPHAFPSCRLHHRLVHHLNHLCTGTRKKKTALEEMLIARHADTLAAEIEEHGGEAKLASTFSKAIRVTTHNERSAASTAFKKTFLSKHNAEYMWCSKVLKGETSLICSTKLKHLKFPSP